MIKIINDNETFPLLIFDWLFISPISISLSFYNNRWCLCSFILTIPSNSKWFFKKFLLAKGLMVLNFENSFLFGIMKSDGLRISLSSDYRNSRYCYRNFNSIIWQNEFLIFDSFHLYHIFLLSKNLVLDNHII